MSRKQRFGTGEYVFSEKYGKDIEKKENSKNREKARIRLAKANRHVANRRKDYSIQTAAYYAKNYDVIVIEDIDMQVMAQSLRLGKSANDLGFACSSPVLNGRHGNVAASLSKLISGLPVPRLVMSAVQRTNS